MQSIDLNGKKDDTMKIRLRAAAGKETLLNALKGLKCVISAAAADSPEEGTAEVVIECRAADEQGRSTDQIFRLLAGMDAPIREMREERDTLEEIFLKNT